jgi:predicted metal-dependent hydrolase
MASGLTKMIKLIEGIGSVSFLKNRKIKRLRITVKHDLSVNVQVPMMLNFKESEHFVTSKLGWIQNQKAKVFKRKALKTYPSPSDLEILNFRALIIEKISQFSLKHSLVYKELNFKWMQSRWGSCSSKNNISLNYWMIFLPNELVDYILLHELLHIKIKSHSNKFWSELESLCHGSKVLNKRLKDEFFI